MADIKQFTKKQMEFFEERLSVKTGWGRNEVKVQLLEATNEALSEILNEMPRAGLANFPNGANK